MLSFGLLVTILIANCFHLLSALCLHLQVILVIDKLNQFRQTVNFTLLLPLVYWSAWVGVAVLSSLALISSVLLDIPISSSLAALYLLLAIAQHLDSIVLLLQSNVWTIGQSIDRLLTPIRLWIEIRLLTTSNAYIPIILITHFVFSSGRCLSLVAQSMQSIRIQLNRSPSRSFRSIVSIKTIVVQSQLIVNAFLFLKALYDLQTSQSDLATIWLLQSLVLLGLVLFMSSWSDFKQKIDSKEIEPNQSLNTDTHIDSNNNNIHSSFASTLPSNGCSSSFSKYSSNLYIGKVPVGVYAAPQPVCSTINRRFG